MRPVMLFMGYAVCRVSAEHGPALLNLFRRQGIVYSPMPSDGESLCFGCRLSLLPQLRRACAASGIALHVQRKGGLPTLFWRYRRRLGLGIGLVLFALVMTLGSRVVWDIRVEGNESVELPVLMEQLKACGLSIGSYLPSLDTDQIEGRLLTQSRQIAWVSVNIKGTVASVQIRELMKAPGQTETEPTNLVAASDGVIESVKLLSGIPSVKVGDVVRKGELLASGVRDSSAYGYRISSARGEVLARTEHTLSITLERGQEQKRVTEEKILEKTLFFFGKAIKIAKSTGIVDRNCDTIKRLEICSLPGGVALPVSVLTVSARAYELETVVLSDEQLRQSAYEQLGRELTAKTAGATLLSQHVSEQITPQGIVLSCRYVCTENIAEPLPLEVGQ